VLRNDSVMTLKL